jgi:lipopolysaccharide export LptBFGC system permease protein LptF
MLNKLDKYFIRQFWSILGVSVLGFVSIYIIVDLIENLIRFMDNKVPAKIVFQYYIYTLPWFVSNKSQNYGNDWRPN